MNKKICLSVACILAINVNAQDLGKIDVIEKVNNKVVNNVNTQDVKSADLAEVLAKKSPSISMIRRSGIANDIILRGQKRDNIKVTVDGGVIHGACPNRMDPPTSHIITSNVKTVEINEGPFDVTEFGNLSGNVKITTEQPQEGVNGSIEATLGSFGYKKGVLNVSGGNKTVKVSATYAKEQSDQYKDGDGNTLAEQTFNAVNGTGAAGTQYATAHKDMKAYEKESLMVKTMINISDNQELSISATKNESDNVLYPSSKMDAIYDDSNLYNVNYTAKELGTLSKKLELNVYKTDVDHPMSTQFRNSGATMSMVNHLTTDTKGLKVMNTFDALGQELLVGLDTSNRNWDGRYYMSNGMDKGKSINDTDTKNNALFLKSTNQIDKLELEMAVRYDDTSIKNGGTLQDNDYSGLTGNIFATYKNNKNTQYFVGIGQSSRVPDARELYNLGKKSNSGAQMTTGTPTLKETVNTEIDFGAEHKYNDGKVKAKFFYSVLEDYIYYNKNKTSNRFENIDAKIYGMELSAAYYLSDSLTVDGGYTYKRGKKDSALSGQTDTDLADITPSKLTVAMTYDHDDNTNAMVEFINVSKWSNYDSDNGEQAIDGYNIVNLKAQTAITKDFELIVGADNIFDKTYAVSNTYADLILLTDGTTSDVMLLNEPGRYIYANLKYKF